VLPIAILSFVVLALVGVAGLRYVATRQSGASTGPTTTVVVEPVSPGGTADAGTLDRVRQLLLARLHAASLSGVSVTVDGSHQLVMRVSGLHEQLLRSLTAVGALSIRRVLQTSLPDNRTVPDPIPDPVYGSNVTLDQVIAKVGSAYQVAQALADHRQISAEDQELLQVFAHLGPDEVAVLPTELQFAIPTIGCAQLLARPLSSPLPDRFASCAAASPPTKYLLDTARVVGADVAHTGMHLDPAGGWALTLTFRDDTQAKWTDLTREVVAQPEPTDQVAIVVDNGVMTAPVIQAVVPGDVDIAGELTKDQVIALSAQLSTGPLPRRVRIVGIQTVGR
jgi:preprotein translocase subunit SecD